MAKDKKQDFLELVKFLIVSCAVGLLQLFLANVLPFVFDGINVPVPCFMQGLFDPRIIFNQETAYGAADYAKYVVNGAVTWGFVIPFFLSNFIANVFGYFQNRNTTFRSNSSPVSFVCYCFILIILILISTWLQGLIVGKLRGSGIRILEILSRTIAAAAAGLLQMAVLFPLEKFVLFKEK